MESERERHFEMIALLDCNALEIILALAYITKHAGECGVQYCVGVEREGYGDQAASPSNRFRCKSWRSLIGTLAITNMILLILH